LAGGSYLRIEAAWREEQAAAAANAANSGSAATANANNSRLQHNTTTRPRSKAGR